MRRGPLQARQILNRQVFRKLIRANSLLDIGAGIRPFDLFSFSTHICVEPHEEYVDILVQEGHTVIKAQAHEVLLSLRGFDCIYLIDVIEHMEKDVGAHVIDMAISVVRKQIFVFTPLGFMEQNTLHAETDPWGLHGGYWQHHRSGWYPEDFPNWDILISEKYHRREKCGAFAAMYTK